MNTKEIQQLLKLYGLKLTLNRFKLLEIFLSNDRAVTSTELLQLSEQPFNRVTIYRTLKLFEDMGIIHRILSNGSSPNYALSGTGRIDKEKFCNQHLHFSCINCAGVYCLDDQLIPFITLPDGYEVHSLNMMVTGICRKCNLKALTQ